MHELIGMCAMARNTEMADQITVRIDDDLEARMDEYRQRHDFPPNKSEVVRKALREMFDRELDG